MAVTFRDVAPILRDPASFASVMAAFRAHIAALGCTCVVGIESRGYLIGAPLALLARVKFVAVRKVCRYMHSRMRAFTSSNTRRAWRYAFIHAGICISDCAAAAAAAAAAACARTQ